MQIIKPNYKSATIFFLVVLIAFFCGYKEFLSENIHFYILFWVLKVSNKQIGFLFLILLPIYAIKYIQINTTKNFIIIEKDFLITPKGKIIQFKEIKKITIFCFLFIKLGLQIENSNTKEKTFFNWIDLGCGVSEFATLVSNKIELE